MRTFGRVLHTLQDSFAHGVDYVFKANYKTGMIGGRVRLPSTGGFLKMTGGEQVGMDADDIRRGHGRKAYKDAGPATRSRMSRFKFLCIGCCCDFGRVKGQKENVKTLCKH